MNDSQNISIKMEEVKTKGGKPQAQSQPTLNMTGVKLSRSARKRYRAAIGNCLTAAEALQAAVVTESKKNKLKKKKNKAKVINVKHVPANAGTGKIKLGFIATSKSPPLSAEHMTILQDAILEVTLMYSTPNVMPQFNGCWPRGEWLELVCVNVITSNWVRSNFAHIKQKSKLDIELLEANQIPRNLIEGYFPNSAQLPDEKVLEFINAQNPVNAKQWRIFRRTANGQILHLSMSIDDLSMKTLKACAGEIRYCFGKVCLNLSKYPKEPVYQQLREAPNNTTNTHIFRNEWNSIVEHQNSVIDGGNNVLQVPTIFYAHNSQFFNKRNTWKCNVRY